MRRYLISAAAAFGLFMGAGPAAAMVFTLDFNSETSLSSNNPATGASGSALFEFSDVTGGVQLDLTITNTTGLLPSGTFGAGATAGQLTQFYFDVIPALTFASVGDLSAQALDNLTQDQLFTPFTSNGSVAGDFDFGLCHRLGNGPNSANCAEGPPASALSPGATSLAVLTFQTPSTAMVIADVLSNAFESGDANAGLRFQDVNAGAGSDRLLYTGSTVSTVPLPATLPLLLGALGVLGFGVSRKRKV